MVTVKIHSSEKRKSERKKEGVVRKKEDDGEGRGDGGDKGERNQRKDAYETIARDEKDWCVFARWLGQASSSGISQRQKPSVHECLQ